MIPISFAIEDETHTAILTLFDNAQKSIYLSIPELRWNVVLRSPSSKETFYNVVKRTCERGVTIYILTGEDFVQLQNQNVTLPSRCFVHYVNCFGPKIKEETVLWNWDNLIGEKLSDGSYVFLGEKRIFVHNLKRYLVMDERIAMIGSFDLSDVSKEEKIRHFPVSAFVKVNKDLLDFVKLNWNTMGVSTMAPPNCFFFGSGLSDKPANVYAKNPEQEMIVNLISSAKKLIFIQTQFFASYELTENTIAHALALRLVKAYQNGKEDPFRCIILTNVDCPQNFRNFYCSKLRNFYCSNYFYLQPIIYYKCFEN